MTNQCAYEKQPLPGCIGDVTLWTTRGENKRYLCKFHAQQEIDNMLLEKQLENQKWPDQRNELKPGSPGGAESKDYFA